MFRIIVFGFALLAALPAVAQLSTPPATPGRDGNAAPLSYRSAFADYKPWQEPEPSSWHAANESAAALGGHLGHLRGNIERAQGHAHATWPPATKPMPER